jgi:hypothetical protein
MSGLGNEPFQEWSGGGAKLAGKSFVVKRPERGKGENAT